MKVLKILIGAALLLAFAVFVLVDATLCNSHMFTCPWS